MPGAAGLVRSATPSTLSASQFKQQVEEGYYSPMVVDLSYLKRHYG
jgi:hypothetical protein